MNFEFKVTNRINKALRKTTKLINEIFDIFKYFERLKDKIRAIVVDIPLYINAHKIGSIQISTPMIITNHQLYPGYNKDSDPTVPSFAYRIVQWCGVYNKMFYHGTSAKTTEARYMSRKMYNLNL